MSAKNAKGNENGKSFSKNLKRLVNQLFELYNISKINFLADTPYID